jgi:arabinogalactan endo-1,4-beta-galactosidase
MSEKNFIMNDRVSKYVTAFCILLIYFLTSGKAFSQASLVLGADLSYVNEIEDCGGFYSEHGVKTDPFLLFRNHGTNLVRVRLWNNPTWTNYSNLKDVEKTILRAKDAGMQVLLDFHYSDDWADPQKQIIPAAWTAVNDLSVLIDSMYQYTYSIMSKLNKMGLLPEMVQVGNEINSEILVKEPYKTGDTINWKRNIALLNAGIKAVHDATLNSPLKPRIMLHIAQPENALVWFENATRHDIAGFDIIGISYYSKWSEYSIDQLYKAIEQLHTKYGKEVIVAETAYPWTLKNFDEAQNILGEDALVPQFPATPEGQYNYLVELTKAVIKGGGSGIIYWEPAWISSPCKTRWGSGSHWENAAFFDPDRNNEVLPAIDFYSYPYFE